MGDPGQAHGRHIFIEWLGTHRPTGGCCLKSGGRWAALGPKMGCAAAETSNRRTSLDESAHCGAASLQDAGPAAPTMRLVRARQFSHVAAAGTAIAVEFEPRFYGLRDINEKAGTFEADIGIKVCDLV